MFNLHKTFQNDINNFTNDEIFKKNEKEYKDLTNAIIEIFLLEKKSEEQISKMYRYKKFGDVHAIIKEYLAKRFSFCFARYGINRDPAVTQIREEEFIGEAFDCRKEKHLLEKNKGVYISVLDDDLKVFAFEFEVGNDMFPFLRGIDATFYKDGYLVCGLDTKNNSYFKP